MPLHMLELGAERKFGKANRPAGPPRTTSENAANEFHACARTGFDELRLPIQSLLVIGRCLPCRLIGNA